MQLKNKTAIVTGGSEGLGLSIVKKLLEKDCKVHVISRDAQKQTIAKEKLNNPNVFFHTVDVTDYKQVENIINSIEQIDILINNAGVFVEGAVENTAPETISSVIDINIKGVIYTTKAVLPQMKRNNDCLILNVVSTAGLKPRGNESVHVASKYAVRGFTDTLKEDLKPTNIKVVGFYPGGMNTKFFEKAGFPKDNQTWMDTDKVADVIITILSLDESMIMDHVVLNKRSGKK